MLTTQTPVTVNQKPRPQSSRKALQPKNFAANQINECTKPSKQEWKEMLPLGEANKENHPAYATPLKMQSFDASLAEELSAIRKKMERLRLDKEKTERMLKERDLVVETWIKDLEHRAQQQKMLEIQVDRLFRLKELQASCMRVSPIRSLREKQGNKIKEARLKDVMAEESVDENSLQSPDSGSESSELVTES